MSETTYRPNTNGKCPHCQHIVNFDKPIEVYEAEERYYEATSLKTKNGGDYVHVYSSKCPSCLKPVVAAQITSDGEAKLRLVHPFNVVRLVPNEVPKAIKQDFLEAAAVSPISEKASAALSRRCLQNVLIDKGAPKDETLSTQIGWILPKLPLYLAENVDYIRNVGNFAAHPIKDKITGTIVDVEPEEASWNLDVLEQLFEFFYVQPSKASEKRKKLDEKLRGAGRRTMKKP